jgi:Zn-dependent metalloprotease
MDNPLRDTVSKACYYAGLGSIDVHFSSGVANHWFYLLAETTNPTTNLPTVSVCTNRAVAGFGIGRDAAGKIVYRALTVYMPSSTNYAGARVATLNAATGLYGAVSSEYNRTRDAWAAVNVL